MAYVDFTYYRDSFGGKTIPEASFKSYERKARIFLDNITFNRLREDETLIDNNVKDCLCEIMECGLKLDNDGGIKSSESTGNVSVSYVINPNTTEYSKYYSIARMYLGNTSLLYRGV
ncbi:hypothetical protein [Clostridium sp. 'White wine YQ']|uniref:hypothetical protein n=1 Tax=Clostridium sp. 'White wine YQ' TaxID=3027474 RepID=UPI0023652790|nr:hypothetical protein [Clostridium sp. 'White wine YQ']MDD7793691.1 hypothetical protein [Clostridium sp. 'White wine YQ']